MSYCRFSSMNWMCDVYVYEDVSGGWTTHVASRRRKIPPIPDLIGNRFSMFLHRWSKCEWNKENKKFIYPYKTRACVYNIWIQFASFWHRNVHMLSLHLIPLKSIGLEYDGESFNDSSALECAERLETLSKMGYKVPKDVIEVLRSEEE